MADSVVTGAVGIFSEPLVNYRHTFPSCKHPSSSTLCNEPLPDSSTPPNGDATDPPTPTSPVPLQIPSLAPVTSTAESSTDLPSENPTQAELGFERPSEDPSVTLHSGDVGPSCVEPAQPARYETHKSVAPRFGFVLVLALFLIVIAVAMLVIFDMDTAANVISSIIQESVSCLQTLWAYVVDGSYGHFFDEARG